jgi:hypothetical protein
MELNMILALGCMFASGFGVASGLYKVGILKP